jgi:hypothetical protein
MREVRLEFAARPVTLCRMREALKPTVADPYRVITLIAELLPKAPPHRALLMLTALERSADDIAMVVDAEDEPPAEPAA